MCNPVFCRTGLGTILLLKLVRFDLNNLAPVLEFKFDNDGL